MNQTIAICDFFSERNSVEGVCEADYERVGLIVDAVRAFERSTYQCVYIIDYYKREFLYVSTNFARLCGTDSVDIKKLGYRFYLDYVPEDDLQMLVSINNSGFDFFNSLPISERRDYTISYDFHIIRGRKRRLINHKITPLVLTRDGKVWLAICTIALSTGGIAGNIIMKKAGSDFFYEYSLLNQCWERKDEIDLADKEREALSLSAQGYTIHEIAELMCKSIDSIKTYRRSVFRKMRVKSIAAALTYAQNHQLL